MKPRIRVHAAVAAALVAEVVLIGAAFGWVAFYSHVVSPGQSLQAYQAHAQVASPWVSIVVGVPLFHALARRVLRDAPTTWAAFGLYLVLDLALLAAALAAGGRLPVALALASYASKAAACAWGLRRAAA